MYVQHFNCAYTRINLNSDTSLSSRVLWRLAYLRPGHKIDLSAYRTERTLNFITIYLFAFKSNKPS